MVEITIDKEIKDEYDAAFYIPKDINIGEKVIIKGLNNEVETYQINDTIKWLISVPSSDTNFQSKANEANLLELETALKIIEKRAETGKGFKTKINKLNQKIKKRNLDLK